MNSKKQQVRRKELAAKEARRTFAAPGSPAKLQALAERARLGLPLHHEKDGPVRDLK